MHSRFKDIERKCLGILLQKRLKKLQLLVDILVLPSVT